MILAGLTGITAGYVIGSAIGEGLEKENGKFKFNKENAARELKARNNKGLLILAVACGVLATVDAKQKDYEEEVETLKEEICSKSDDFAEVIYDYNARELRKNMKKTADLLKDVSNNEIGGVEMRFHEHLVNLNKLESIGLKNMEYEEIDHLIEKDILNGAKQSYKEIVKDSVDNVSLKRLRELNKRMDEIIA